MDIGDLPFVPDTFFDDDEEEFDLPEGPYEALILPLADLVVFPRMVTPIYVGRPPSLSALEDAVREDWPLVLLTQRDPDLEHYPALDDLYTVGTDVSVLRTLRMPDGSTSAIVRRISQRVRVVKAEQRTPYLVATVDN